MANTNGKAATVKFTLDGKEVEALPGETIWQVAKRQGIEIPHLCYSPDPGYRADGNCRACMVEIEGENMRPVTWVIVEEVRSGRWGIGGNALGTADVLALAAGVPVG